MFVELWQAWCHDHIPGEPVPVTDHPLSEEPFPNVQSELPLMQFHSISSCPAADHQRREISVRRCRLWWGHPSAFSAPSWTNQAASVATRKSCSRDISPSWSPSSGHTLIIWCPSYIGHPKLHTREVGLHRCGVEWDNHLPQPAAMPVLDALQDTAGPFGDHSFHGSFFFAFIFCPCWW